TVAQDLDCGGVCVERFQIHICEKKPNTRADARGLRANDRSSLRESGLARSAGGSLERGASGFSEHAHAHGESPSVGALPSSPQVESSASNGVDSPECTAVLPGALCLSVPLVT